MFFFGRDLSVCWPEEDEDMHLVWCNPRYFFINLKVCLSHCPSMPFAGTRSSRSCSLCGTGIRGKQNQSVTGTQHKILDSTGVQDGTSTGCFHWCWFWVGVFVVHRGGMSWLWSGCILRKEMLIEVSLDQGPSCLESWGFGTQYPLMFEQDHLALLETYDSRGFGRSPRYCWTESWRLKHDIQSRFQTSSFRMCLSLIMIVWVSEWTIIYSGHIFDMCVWLGVDAVL